MEKGFTTFQAIQEVIVVLLERKTDAESKQQGQHALIYDVVQFICSYRDINTDSLV